MFRLGKLSTPSPNRFTPEDVHNFLFYRMSLDVSDLASNTTRMYADRVSKGTGVDVDLRKCRRTYGQRLVDMAISVVSVVMGYLSTRTTEQHYARVNHEVVVKEIARTFKNMEASQKGYNDSQMPKGSSSGARSASTDRFGAGKSQKHLTTLRKTIVEITYPTVKIVSVAMRSPPRH